MNEIIVNLESLLTQFQTKFLEIEDILHNTNKQFTRLKMEYVKHVPNDNEESVMSMKDFVSYMSALEETECDETSQNISELPLDNEVSLKSESEETPVINQGLQVDRSRSRKSSMTMSNSFGWHEVIPEEDEADDVKMTPSPNEEKIIKKLQRPTSIVTNEEKIIKKLQRPTSIVTDPAKKKGSSKNEESGKRKLARPTSIATQKSNVKSTKTSNNISEKNTLIGNTMKQDKNQNNRKPTNLDFVNIRVRPDLRTFPVVQHPETALLASATPSPMTPSEDKVPRIDLDKLNNNQIQKISPKDTNLNNTKFQIKESKLPILSKAVLSPTSTPRNNQNQTPELRSVSASSSTPTSSSSTAVQRNLTKTVCRKPNAELIQCRKCGKVKCIQPSHNHSTRTKIKTQIKKAKNEEIHI